MWLSNLFCFFCL
jgi:hypothetical protein